jgi:hypothetical protein
MSIDRLDEKAFKWIALAIGTGFLVALTWMVNDMRLQVRETTEIVQKTGETVKQTGETLNDRLPDLLNRTLVVTETVSELAMDIRNLKSVISKVPLVRADEELAAYAGSVLLAVEKSGATIGQKASSGKGLNKPVPASKWASSASRQPGLVARLARSKRDVALRLSNNVLGHPWYMQFPQGDKEPVLMLEWLKKNHPPTRALFSLNDE